VNSYDDTSFFISHSFCDITDSMSTYCKNDMWTETLADSELVECYKFECIDDRVA